MNDRLLTNPPPPIIFTEPTCLLVASHHDRSYLDASLHFSRGELKKLNRLIPSPCLLE